MFEYIHITNGRLRVRIASLKANASGAQNLQIKLRQVAGVRSVQIKLLTGSVLVLHDGTAATSEAVSSELGAIGQSALAVAIRNPRNLQVLPNVAGMVLSHFAEAALERLLLASIALLL